MDLETLKTPCALVDIERVEANTERMAKRIADLGARLRPHVKTHKCAEVARLQVRDHFGGITVSTLAEAAFFARAGFNDITYAVPIAPSRIAEASVLARSVSLHLILDHDTTLQELEQCARAKRVRFSVFLKVDSGYRRAGVDPSREESVALALKVARSPHIDFRGLLTHAGQSYHCRDAAEIRGVARREREVMVGFADRLRRSGVAVPEVSIGSTPTMSVVENLQGVTEVRPGNYAFYDRFQVAIGSCTLDDVAFSVLAEVVGKYPEQNKLLIDAGALAFSKDPGPTHVDRDCGYGTFFSPDGRCIPELFLSSLSQEHGQVVGTRPLDLDDYPIGSRLRVVPNHACLSAALFDRYHVVRHGQVVDEWTPVRGW